MPFQKFVDPKTGEFYPTEHIYNVFAAELNPSKDIITTCGTGIFLFDGLITGVTASILFLALEASEFPSKQSLYDGSWTEYATRHANNPIMIQKNREP